MRDLEQTDLGIGEEEVTRSQPMVRALLVQRLEQIWNQCQPHVDGSVKPDPRFIEAGIRVLDRLAKLYRLDQSLTSAELSPEDPKRHAVTQAMTALAEFEARMSEQ
jgi:hypothetical protein